MRTADGRIILNDVEYHYVECSGCGEPTLTKKFNNYVTCQTCGGSVDDASERQVYGDRTGRHWERHRHQVES